MLGKGRRAKELIAMPPPCGEAVRAWIDVRGTKAGPLLLSLSRANRHGRLVTRGVYRIIRDLGAAAGVHVRPHGIRHTAITQAIDAAHNTASVSTLYASSAGTATSAPC